MNKQDYAITNILVIKDFNGIIKNDLLHYWINQKYTFVFENKENTSIGFLITAFNCNNGFDIGFDMIRMI